MTSVDADVSDNFNYEDAAYDLLRGSKHMEQARDRWELVLSMWSDDGKNLEEIAVFIGSSTSTVRRLLKRAFKERLKNPNFKWPTDKQGRKICDVPHPWKKGEQSSNWTHVKSSEIKPGVRFCHVCAQQYHVGKTLIEVFSS